MPNHITPKNQYKAPVEGTMNVRQQSYGPLELTGTFEPENLGAAADADPNPSSAQ